MRKKTNPPTPIDSFRATSSTHRDVVSSFIPKSSRYPESEQILTSHRSIHLVPNLEIDTLIR